MELTIDFYGEILTLYAPGDSSAQDVREFLAITFRYPLRWICLLINGRSVSWHDTPLLSHGEPFKKIYMVLDRNGDRKEAISLEKWSPSPNVYKMIII